nr:hypothetical protein [Capnocytophaga canimorsus]
MKYDLIGRLVMETGLTRRTLVAILKGIRPETFYQFRMNPEEFIRKTANIINDEKAMAVVQKICYERTGNTYDVDIFHRKHYPRKSRYQCHQKYQVSLRLGGGR